MESVAISKITSIELKENAKYIITDQHSDRIYLASANQLSILNLKTEKLIIKIEFQETLIGFLYQNFFERIIIFTKNFEFISYDLQIYNRSIFVPKLSSEFNIRKFNPIQINICPSQEMFVVIANYENSESYIFVFDKHFHLDNFKQIKINILQSKIVFRPDSKYFAIFCVSNSGTVVFTYSRNLEEIQSQSLEDHNYPMVKNVFQRPDKNLSNIGTWFSNNSLLVTLTTNEDQIQKNIMTFEKNGLRYLEFEIPISIADETFKPLYFVSHSKNWNILSLFYQNLKKKRFGFLIILRNNGKYIIVKDYPIQTKLFEDKIVYDIIGVKDFQWKLGFEIYFNSDQNSLFIIQIEFKFEKSIYPIWNKQLRQGEIDPCKELFIWIEGDQLKLTPLQKCLIPPPLSFSNLKIDSSISALDVKDDKIFLITSDSVLIVIQIKDDFQIELIARKEIKNLQNKNLFRNCFVGKKQNKIVFGLIVNKDILEIIEFSNEPNNQKIDKNNYLQDLTEESLQDQNIGYIENFYWSIPQLDSENNIKINIYSQNKQNLQQFDLEKCEFLDSISLPISSDIQSLTILSVSDSSQCFIFLTQEGKLYLNHQLISNDCTSYILNKLDSIEQLFLSYTIISPTPFDILQTIRINKSNTKPNLEDMKNNNSIKSGEQNWTFQQLQIISSGIFTRQIEKSSIVYTSFGSNLVFLQQRGNLETITSRYLLYHQIRNLCQQKQYQLAFKIIRTQRLKGNLLIDFDIEGFLNSLKDFSFLVQLGRENFDLFIQSLDSNFSDEIKEIVDVNELKKLKNYLACNLTGNEYQQFIFQEMLNSSEKITNPEFIWSRLALYEKLNQIQNGLLLIKSFKDKNLNENKNQKFPHKLPTPSTVPKTEITYNSLLKYFSWLVKGEELYKFALSLYDLELSEMVTEYTNIDPKEYLPYLKSLKEITDPIEFKAKICVDQGRYSDAINELSNGIQINFEYALDLVKRHSLYINGLSAFSKKNKEYYLKIKKEYGLYLYTKKEYKQAIIMISEFQELKKEMLECCEKTLDWESGLILFENKEEKDCKLFLQKIKDQLIKLKAYTTVRKISKQLNEGKTQEIIYCIKGEEFTFAKRKIQQLGKQGLNSNEIQKEIQLAHSIIINDFLDRTKKLTYQKNRINIVQEYKINNPDEEINGPEMSELSMSSINKSENVSFATGVSKFANRRGKRPKNLLNRKHKEGAIYEEEWLVEAINSANYSEEDDKKIGSFFSLLLSVGFVNEFLEIKDVIGKYLKLIERKGIQKTLIQKEFEQKNTELNLIYGHLKDFDPAEIWISNPKSFDILNKFN